MFGDVTRTSWASYVKVALNRFLDSVGENWRPAGVFESGVSLLPVTRQMFVTRKF
jgi:hypothetical protein